MNVKLGKVILCENANQFKQFKKICDANDICVPKISLFPVFLTLVKSATTIAVVPDYSVMSVKTFEQELNNGNIEKEFFKSE